MEAVLSATFGSPGSGKTYSRVRWLVDDFLLNSDGVYITNIPLNIDVIVDYVYPRLLKSSPDISREDVRSRLHVIPSDVIISWEKLNHLDNRDLKSFTAETFPPTVYFQGFNLDNAHIAIDEFHKVFGKKTPKFLRSLWNDWFAEIRKTGCVFEAITQSYGQMNDEFLDKCATRLELLNHSDSKDPFFWIKMSDWYELRAGLFNRPVLQRVTVRETMRSCSDSGRLAWKPTGHNTTFLLTSDYFRFYDSFANSSGVSGKRVSPSEKYGRKVVFWFFKRHFFTFFWRFLVVFFFLWVTLGGGIKFFIHKYMSVMTTVQDNNSVSSSQDNNSVSSSQDNNSVSSSQDNNSVSSSQDNSSGSSQDNSSGSSQDNSSGSSQDNTDYVFFDSSLIVLKDGTRIFVGGHYAGLKVVSIDFRSRSFSLSDGSFIRL